jgi:hypothetical protein
LQHPKLVQRLVLAWPATAGDLTVDARTRERLRELGAHPATIAALLAGETLRGTSDVELGRLAVDVAVVPSLPGDSFHQQVTVDRLLRVVPRSIELVSCPPPMRPEFSSHVQDFALQLERFVHSPQLEPRCC